VSGMVLCSKIFNAKNPQNLQRKFFVSFVLNEFDRSFFAVRQFELKIGGAKIDAVKHRFVQSGGDMKSGLFVRFPFRIPTIEYKKAEICNRPVSRIPYICWTKNTL
jgi:hypothetical protein